MLLQILQLIVIIINELADRTSRDYVSLGSILRFVDREVGGTTKYLTSYRQMAEMLMCKGLRVW
jgi:hypothetical protein